MRFFDGLLCTSVGRFIALTWVFVGVSLPATHSFGADWAERLRESTVKIHDARIRSAPQHPDDWVTTGMDYAETHDRPLEIRPGLVERRIDFQGGNHALDRSNEASELSGFNVAFQRLVPLVRDAMSCWRVDAEAPHPPRP